MILLAVWTRKAQPPGGGKRPKIPKVTITVKIILAGKVKVVSSSVAEEHFGVSVMVQRKELGKDWSPYTAEKGQSVEFDNLPTDSYWRVCACAFRKEQGGRQGPSGKNSPWKEFHFGLSPEAQAHARQVVRRAAPAAVAPPPVVKEAPPPKPVATITPSYDGHEVVGRMTRLTKPYHFPPRVIDVVFDGGEMLASFRGKDGVRSYWVALKEADGSYSQQFFVGQEEAKACDVDLAFTVGNAQEVTFCIVPLFMGSERGEIVERKFNRPVEKSTEPLKGEAVKAATSTTEAVASPGVETTTSSATTTATKGVVAEPQARQAAPAQAKKPLAKKRKKTPKKKRNQRKEATKARNEVLGWLRWKFWFKSTRVVAAAKAVLAVEGIKLEEAKSVIEDMLKREYPEQDWWKARVVAKIKVAASEQQMDFGELS